MEWKDVYFMERFTSNKSMIDYMCDYKSMKRSGASWISNGDKKKYFQNWKFISRTVYRQILTRKGEETGKV